MVLDTSAVIDITNEPDSSHFQAAMRGAKSC